MKLVASAVVLIACSTLAQAQQFTDVVVTGGSTPFTVDLGNAPAFIGLTTNSRATTIIDLVPAMDGTQAASLVFSMWNATGDLWTGVALEVNDNGFFNSDPILLFGGDFESGFEGHVGGIITDTNPGEFLDFIVDITIQGETRFRVTPQIPEPATVAIAASLAPLLLRTRRGR
ncbi:MAG: hypothetical protein AAGE65_13170 [Planctomycetota bacterium]